MNLEYDILLTFPSANNLYHSHMIPLGIASIAAVLEKHQFKVKVIDFNFYTGNFSSDLKKWNPKIVGVGGTTTSRKNSFKIAQLVKEVLPQIPIVYGGPHATFAVKDTLINTPSIDFILKGEAEFTFLELCNKFVRNKDIDINSIPGICYRNNNKIIENKHIRINNLEDLPIAARHLFEHNYPLKLDFFDFEADYIMTSRGCPKCCSFCSASRMFPGGVRLRPIESVKEEIDSILANKSIKGLKIFDSTFTADRNHVLKFCEMIKPYGLLWECEIRADTVDYFLLKKMKESGCCYVNIGLETTNQRILQEIHKKITVSQTENVLEWCNELGIKTKVFFIFGHIGQTFKECIEDIRWLRKHKHKIDFFANSMGLKLYPGTLLEKKAKQFNLIPKNFSWAKYKPSIKNIIFLEFGDVLSRASTIPH